MELSKTTFACPSWWLSNECVCVCMCGTKNQANRSSGKKGGSGNIHYLNSARSIAQSRIALRRKPQCMRSYMRIMKTCRLTRTIYGDTYATSRATVTRRVIRRGMSLPNLDRWHATYADNRPPTSNNKNKNKMRQNRSKAYRKLMAMYSTSFGFRQPYQVLGACCANQRPLLLAREFSTYPPPPPLLRLISPFLSL